MGQGFAPAGIAAALAAPPGFDNHGTLSHGSKVVYERYLGWYDGNPEYMGGAAAVIARARDDSIAGNYRRSHQDRGGERLRPTRSSSSVILGGPRLTQAVFVVPGDDGSSPITVLVSGRK
jgi:hypothetical protein